MNAAEIHFFRKSYVRYERDFDDLLMFSLHADLQNLLSSFLVTAECNILADEDRTITEALCNGNVEVEVEERVYHGTTHCFFETVRIATISDRTLNKAASWFAQ